MVYIDSINAFSVLPVLPVVSLPRINSHHYSYIHFYWICMQCYVEETARLWHQYYGLDKPSSSRALSSLFFVPALRSTLLSLVISFDTQVLFLTWESVNFSNIHHHFPKS